MQIQNLRLTLEDRFNDRVGLTVTLSSCLHSVTSAYQHIAVYHSADLGKIMALGGSIALTECDEAWYAEQLVHPALCAIAAPKRVLVIGGGDGGIARECLRYASVQQVTVVEIDQQVVETARQFFPTCAASLTDPRVRLVFDDAHRWLEANQESFDAVIIDSAELVNAPSDAFFTSSFAEAVFRALDPKGVLVLPLGCPTFETALCRASLAVLQTRFPKPHLYQLNLPSLPTGEWVIAWCSASRSPLDVLSEPTDAEQLQSWHRGLQPGLFSLPLHVMRQLGM